MQPTKEVLQALHLFDDETFPISTYKTILNRAYIHLSTSVQFLELAPKQRASMTEDIIYTNKRLFILLDALERNIKAES